MKNLKLLADLEKRKIIPNQEFVEEINNAHSDWSRRTVVQDEYKEMTVAQLIFRAGGPKRFNFPKQRRVARALTELPQLCTSISCPVYCFFF